ncbi:NCS1 family nucleobase:cation symporter-1 [Nocardia transvalensis]|uniref:NCS1 family nucleobase:cation symporter-1 n=1 Tax=Nocardia transvalensis TaxID=37333 RepID=A0A7W9UH18_9NOCA|nr:NCS1 family nucleobase:cation symporter-1 [Nocardia transvalensis]MBB5912677.1 NCS1 family nucleobase:cation symporter-1 [Nocardia transvalensis]
MSEPPSLSARLHNPDLAPATTREWSGYSVFALWMSVLHNVGAYTFAIGFFFRGLSTWAVLAAMAVALVVVYLLMNLSGAIGQRTGVPYPVVARIGFGVFGANLPALVRGVLAVFWYGVQTYLGSVAISALALRLLPGLASWNEHGLLGLSALGWCCFLALWAVQLLVVRHGMEAVRRYQNWAGPAVYLVMFLLLGWVLVRTGGAPGFEVSAERVHGGSAVLQFASIVGLIVAFFGTFLLNISDFTRSSPSPRSMRRANLWGLPVNFLVFAVTVAVVTTGSATLFGEAVTDPIELVQRIDNTPVLVFATLVFTVATVGVNVAANVVSPAFDFSNIAPRYITFERGGVIAAIGSILVCPWALYSSPVVVDYFIGGLGALLGPLFGVIVTDFYLVRRGRVDVAALYVEGAGPYWYRRGVNPRAMAAAALGAVVAIPVALLPAWHAAAPFSWALGAALAAAAYLAMGRGATVGTEPEAAHA